MKILIILLIAMFLVSCAPITEDGNDTTNIVSDEDLADLVNEGDALDILAADLDADEDLDLDLGLE
jgi:hypothetical protein